MLPALSVYATSIMTPPSCRYENAPSVAFGAYRGWGKWPVCKLAEFTLFGAGLAMTASVGWT